jgi:hypothetical protein
MHLAEFSPHVAAAVLPRALHEGHQVHVQRAGSLTVVDQLGLFTHQHIVAARLIAAERHGL